MPLRWLEEDDEHPVRPDLPVFRHLTFTEVHALELGAYIGLLAYFGFKFDMQAQILTLLIGIARFTFSDGKAKAGNSKLDHRMGFHDVREEPPYFGAGVVFAIVLIAIAVEVWALAGLGGI